MPPETATAAPVCNSLSSVVVGDAPELEDDLPPLEPGETVDVTVLMFLVPVDVSVEVGRIVVVGGTEGKLSEEVVIDNVKLLWVGSWCRAETSLLPVLAVSNAGRSE
jgi:hypothetical protein